MQITARAFALFKPVAEFPAGYRQSGKNSQMGLRQGSIAFPLQ
jgi:hypothetical protein